MFSSYIKVHSQNVFRFDLTLHPDRLAILVCDRVHKDGSLAVREV